MPGELAVPALIEILENEDPKIRAKAAAMLCLFPDKRAVEPLIRHLKDSNESVIGSAARALGCIADPRAADALIDVLGNRKLSGFERGYVAWRSGRLASHARLIRCWLLIGKRRSPRIGCCKFAR